MHVLKKLKRAFIISRNSSKSSEKPNSESSMKNFAPSSILERAYEYHKARNAIERQLLDHQLDAATLLNNPMAVTTTNHTGIQMGAINQAWNAAASQSMASMPYETPNRNLMHFTVEKVDNGFILRSAKSMGDLNKTKIAANADELKDLFIASIVEHRMET
jgi:hypothetical protein